MSAKPPHSGWEVWHEPYPIITVAKTANTESKKIFVALEDIMLYNGWFTYDRSV